MANATERTLRPLLLGIAGLALALAACGTGDDESADADADAEATELGGLDLATLVAEVDEGTFQAESLETAFVGEVNDELSIGVAVEDGPAGEPRPVTVYLCDDRVIGEWLTGEIDASGAATLTATETMIDYGGDGELRIELVVTDDEVSGSVAFADTFAESFTAEPAGEGAGLFRGEEIFDGDRHLAGWIVFDDGRRVGTHCRWARNPMTGDRICVCTQAK